MNLPSKFAVLVISAMLAAPSLLAVEEKAARQPGFKPYPLDTCLVGGEKLTSMGTPFAFKYEGRIIKFCCQGCIDDFKKDHDKFMAKLAEADKNAPAKSKESQPTPPKP